VTHFDGSWVIRDTISDGHGSGGGYLMRWVNVIMVLVLHYILLVRLSTFHTLVVR